MSKLNRANDSDETAFLQENKLPVSITPSVFNLVCCSVITNIGTHATILIACRPM